MWKSLFTIEDFSILLSQIEACKTDTVMSSVEWSKWPMIPAIISFFGGITELCFFLNIPPNILIRWQIFQRVFRYIWKWWNREYLSPLQQQSKWLHLIENINFGDLVLIKHEHLTSLQWKLGRIIQTFSDMWWSCNCRHDKKMLSDIFNEVFINCVFYH